MPHTKCTDVFYFSELSDTAKDRARDRYREHALDYDWWESVYSDAADAAAYLGIDLHRKPTRLMSGKIRYDLAIYFSGFCSQGDGACFEGTWRAGDMKTLKGLQADFGTAKELYRIHRALRANARKHPEVTTYVKHTGNYSHARSVDYRHEFGSHEDRPNLREAEEAIEEALRDFMRWMYQRLAQEHDYLNSDEQVDEGMAANEYEFTEDGRRIA